jgi:hypothetical protein
MNLKDLPERWRIQLQHYTDLKYGAEYKFRGQISAGDFAIGFAVHIQLNDSSEAFFQNVFFLKAPELKEVAIFTEHCGYHIFPLVDTKLWRYEQNTENISEIFYLLNFFSQTHSQQWELVPSAFTPVWLEGSSVYCNIYNPIYFLFCILADSIDSIDRRCGLSYETIDILENEMYTLVYYWMIESHDEVFDIKEEVIGHSNIKIWLVLRRLCKAALSCEDWGKYQIEDLSFEYFLEKYASPFDSSV